MPLFYENQTPCGAKIAIWQISETEDFFLEKVPVSRYVHNLHKRLQHLAGRYVLQYLAPDFPISLIQIADSNKPYLPNQAYQFSVSHAGDFAAAIVAPNRRVGMDIEFVRPKVAKVQHKFVNAQEEKWLSAGTPFDALGNATLIWSAKESLFKWFGLGAVDFQEHLDLQWLSNQKLQGNFRRVAPPVSIPVNYHLFNELGLMLTWVSTTNPLIEQ